MANENEHDGPMWKHPYMLYVILTVVIFGFLGLMGYLAWTNGWIPNRGVAA